MSTSWKSLLPVPALEKLQIARDSFVSELTHAKEGKPSSLSYLKNPLPQKTLIDEEDHLQVMVIGGSILVTAVATKEDETFTFSKKSQHPLPKLTSSQELFSFLESCAHEETSVLGLNFAFPIESFMRGQALDGKLMMGTKEHDLQDLVGKPIGQSIEDYFREKKQRDLKVAMANDLVCLALAAGDICPPDNTAYLILGTGINAGFAAGHETIINLETANFDKFTPSPAALQGNKDALAPQMAQLEKEVAGGYLQLQYNYIAKEYPQPGLQPAQETKDLNDRITAHEDPVAQAIFRKSAALVSSCIAGLYQYLGESAGFCVVIEGSMIRKSFVYRDYVYEYLKQLEIKDAVRFVSIEDSSLLGAARLVAP